MILRTIVMKNGIKLLWCKGAPAGGVGFLTSIFTSIPFVVDSFEPHSEYMVQSGTWLKSSPKYILQRWLEGRTIKHASALLPVSYKFADLLLKKGLPRKNVFVCPCVVDVIAFSFNGEARKKIREKLMVNESSIVGIYVGKFGGLYYEEEAFCLYHRLFSFFGAAFFLVIITEADPAVIESKFRKYQLPTERIFLSKVPHRDIGEFLSAADFAISTIKSVPVMRYCSPIKHGEYWAADLPILSTLQEGDDADLISKKGGGILISVSDPKPEKKMSQLKSILLSRSCGYYSKLAHDHRNPSVLKLATEFVLQKWVTINRLAD